jgi:hypothetical protein
MMLAAVDPGAVRGSFDNSPAAALSPFGYLVFDWEGSIPGFDRL